MTGDVPSKSLKVIINLVVVTVLLMLPLLLVGWLGWHAAGGIAFISSCSGILAAIGVTFRQLLWYSVASAVSIFFGMLSADLPIAAALVLGATGVAMGLSERWGIARWIMLLPMVAGYAVAEPPTLVNMPVVDALLIAVIGFAATLFSGGMVALALRKHAKPKLPEIGKKHKLAFTINLGVLLAIAGFLTSYFSMEHTGTWLVLTVVVIVQPYVDKATIKGLGRAAGTLVGFLIAIGVAYSVHVPIFYIAIGIAFLAVAAVYSLTSKPYWLYAMFLTPGVVLLSSTGTDVTQTADFRLQATVEGAVLCLVVLGIEWLIFRKGQLSAPAVAAPTKK